MQQTNTFLVPLKLALFLSCFVIFATPSIATNAYCSLIFDIGVTRYRGSGEFYKGEPICVRAGIRRQDHSKATEKDIIQIGAKDNPWYKDIIFTVYRIQGAEGQSNQLYDVHLEQIINQTEKNELKANEISRSFWAINPDGTSKLPAGRYSIQARFDTTVIAKKCPQIVYTNMLCSEVSVVLNEPPGDNSGKAEVVEAQARFFGLLGKHADEIALLKQVAHLTPSSKEIHCRIGRAYELQGDIENALREYRLYVEWAKKQPSTGKGGPSLPPVASPQS